MKKRLGKGRDLVKRIESNNTRAPLGNLVKRMKRRLSELFDFMSRASAAEMLLKEREVEAEAEERKWEEVRRRWGLGE